MTRPAAVQAGAGFVAFILAAHCLLDAWFAVFVLPAALTALGIRASIAAPAVVLGTAIGDYRFFERMFLAVDGQWLFPSYYFNPMSREVVAGFAAALCASWIGSLVGARLAGERASRQLFRRWKSASVIVGGSMALLLFCAYIITHLRPGDEEIMAEYERLAALTFEELQAIALASDVSVEERRDAVAMLGNMGEPDEHLDKRLGILAAIQSTPGIEERVASEAENRAQRLHMFRYADDPRSWLWGEEDWRRMSFHEDYLRHRRRLR